MSGMHWNESIRILNLVEAVLLRVGECIEVGVYAGSNIKWVYSQVFMDSRAGKVEGGMDSGSGV